MGKIRSQMISVRMLLKKMRTHAVVSVLAAVILVTLLCGTVISAGIRHLDHTRGQDYRTARDHALFLKRTA